jgi:hypothetical protein
MSAMTAIGPKRTSQVAPLVAAHMSAFDPKQTSMVRLWDHSPTRFLTPALRQSIWSFTQAAPA